MFDAINFIQYILLIKNIKNKVDALLIKTKIFEHHKEFYSLTNAFNKDTLGNSALMFKISAPFKTSSIMSSGTVTSPVYINSTRIFSTSNLIFYKIIRNK